MTEAINRIGRGADAFEGEPYQLPLSLAYRMIAATPSRNPISNTCSMAPRTSPV